MHASSILRNLPSRTRRLGAAVRWAVVAVVLGAAPAAWAAELGTGTSESMA